MKPALWWPVVAVVLAFSPNASIASHWKTTVAECTADPSSLVKWAGYKATVTRKTLIDQCGAPAMSIVVDHMEYVVYYGPQWELTYALNRGDAAAHLDNGKIVSYDMEIHSLAAGSIEHMHHPPEVNAEDDARKRAERDEQNRKLISCRNNPTALIGLSRASLRSRCGPWSSRRATTTVYGTREQMAYGYSFEGGPFLFVYVDDGVVTSVQER